LEALLDSLQDRGALSEQRFVEALVHVRARRYGPARIGRELREKGVSDSAIADTLQDLKATELESARRVWQKKFGTAPRDLQEYAKQARFLERRGFYADTINKLLREVQRTT
jgi:regulatory protein